MPSLFVSATDLCHISHGGVTVPGLYYAEEWHAYSPEKSGEESVDSSPFVALLLDLFAFPLRTVSSERRSPVQACPAAPLILRPVCRLTDKPRRDLEQGLDACTENGEPHRVHSSSTNGRCSRMSKIGLGRLQFGSVAWACQGDLRSFQRSPSHCGGSSAAAADWYRFCPAFRLANVLGVSCGGLHMPGTKRRDGRRD